jgi:hypothetical protein
MQDICHNPKPTHDDMGLIPAQGRNMEAVQQDVADVRAAQRAQRMGPSQGPQWVYDGDDTEEE